MKALELAETLDGFKLPSGYARWHLKDAAAELRRLAEVNAELVEVLMQFADVCQAETHVELLARLGNVYKNAAQVVAKAKEQQ